MLHLRYFVAVAEELNFSQAARKLHMAASPLSQRIKDLERELHQTLFDRTTHHVELTPAGAALLPMAREVLERVNSIPWRLREAVRPQRTTLLIGMPSGVHPGSGSWRTPAGRPTNSSAGPAAPPASPRRSATAGWLSHLPGCRSRTPRSASSRSCGSGSGPRFPPTGSRAGTRSPWTS
ncbi:LysR family transcriptional regulator [Streptomyces sp. NPDC015125]|uniref:LysR family transcriptional regulator n=1 Tax=Streptomyces sp. NPDC015125 TaxID=3364938 RepID=UPI0036FA64B5